MFTKKLFKSGDNDTSRMTALDHSQAIIEFSPTGTILHANRNFLDTMGYSLDEIKGKHHAMFVDPQEAASGEYRKFWADLSGGKFRADEFRRLGKNGREVWIQASYNPLKDSSGRVTGVMKIASDITARKNRSADFQGQIAALHRAQAVIEFTPDGTILSANENFCSALEYELAEITGKHHSMFVKPDEQGPEYKAFWDRLRSGHFQSAQYCRLGKGGNEIWIQATYNPIFNAGGEVVKVVKFATDITEEYDRRRKRREMSAQVDSDLMRILDAVTNASSQITEASASARETALSVENVATGSSQLASSVDEISEQVNNASDISRLAVEKTGQATRSINELTETAQQITHIINLISSIADQTNLLALNATIEAARAGEAGRGFAVVAGEVKALATQSAKATEDIVRQITSVQKATDIAVGNIAEIAGVIERINDISISISGAVEEQAVVTRDISRNMREATSAVSSISSGVDGFAESTNLIKSSTEKVKELSAQIAC